MLTLHTGRALVLSWDGGTPLPGGAVAVQGDRIAAVGTLDELRARFPQARVRSWPGVLGPGRTHGGVLPAAPSPRERVHAVLKTGGVAVTAGAVTDPALRAAAARAGVLVLPAEQPVALAESGRADLAVFDADPGAPGHPAADAEAVVTVCAGRIVHRRH
ncbi:imidazolonepropionase-like domain-containing protein [Streptomyces uncialis]|uniref:imidazolonepropionase-like domain-containing protein n=1 Tax=Streptomyces uncialis TaxID=1048205 RepID=UPI0038154CCC